MNTTFNLVKAQKYVDRLTNSLKNNDKSSVRWMKAPVYEPTITTNLSSFSLLQGSSTNNINENFDNVRNKTRNGFQSRLNVIKDQKKLKTAIYNMNSQVGLSDILTDIDYLNEVKTLYTSIKTKLEQATNTIPFTNLPQIYEKYINDDNSQQNYQNINIALYTVDEVSQKIIELNRQIASLEDQRDKLNATNSITFNFSNDSLSILGL